VMPAGRCQRLFSEGDTLIEGLGDVSISMNHSHPTLDRELFSARE
jgi:hypothetical protein